MTVTLRYTSATLVYNKTGLSSSEVNLSDDNILTALGVQAESELDSVAGRRFDGANSMTEYFDGSEKDAINNYQTRITLGHYPIQSIVALNFLAMDGTTTATLATLSSANISAGTYSTTDYWLEVSYDPLIGTLVPTGGIRFKTLNVPVGTQTVIVQYTHGYGSVPTIIADLATCLVGIRSWLYFLGGQYNRLNSYQIPQQSVNKGDFYQRGKDNIALLTEEAERLWKRVGKREHRLVFASSGAR